LAVTFLGVATLAAAAFLVERGAGLSGNAIISASYHGPTRRDGKKKKDGVVIENKQETHEDKETRTQ
jgi:hypothetical protein